MYFVLVKYFHWLFLACLVWFCLGATAKAQTQLPEPGSFTANELITKANRAFVAKNFPEAEAYFLALERDFSEEAELKEVIQRNYALIALCMISNGKGAETLPYIKKALEYPTWLSSPVLEELSFWDAILKLQAGEYRAAQESMGRFFRQTKFDYFRRLEALTLFGTCYSLQNYHKTAAEFFNHQVPNLRKAKGGEPYASRAVVLQMMALVQSEQYDSALLLLKREFPNLKSITQIISFQTLALQLGSYFMDQDDYYSAIACLQRIWTRDRLLKHQTEQLAALKEKRGEMRSNPQHQSTLFRIDGSITRIERELRNFEKIPDFDAALRLRLATAFQNLERYREAALIMEDMLQRMETSPIVESASLAVIQCWSQLERWPRALKAAENYLQTFGDQTDNKNLPQVLFMKADAMMQMQMNQQAELVFTTISESFPKHTLAVRANFMKGFCQMLQDKNEEGIRTFDQIIKTDPDSSIGQDAFYWKGMCYSFSQKYTECFDHMAEYLKKYKKSGLKYEPQAAFRMAYSTFCNADYIGAIKEFRAFLATYGNGAPDRDEAYLLLGDALLGEGKADEGITAYGTISPSSTRFFEDGYFKVGKAYKLLEEIPTMRAHYHKFLTEYPGSQKMPEAVYWIGWTHVHTDNLEKAKQVYWDTINQHGDNPSLFSIEELLLALPRVYKRQGPRGLAELSRKLQSLYIESNREKKNTLAVRALWAEAMLKKSNPEGGQATALLIRLASLIDPEIHNPRIVADAADALVEKEEYKRGAQLYKDLRKWNPISAHKARAYKGLGLIAERQGQIDQAIDYYKDYEKAAASTTDLAGVILKRIKLQIDQGKATNAKTDLENLLESPISTTAHKAEALYLIGENLAEAGQFEKATAYYERIYIVYGKYRNLVAKSYYRRGESLEKLGRPEAAYEVYAELAARKDLKDYRESTLGRRKKDELSEYAPKLEEEPATDGKETAL